MKTSEIIVFIVYLLCMLGIGIFFFVKNRNGGEKTYFLGGREMGPWVAALSAGASDMSAWVLMGLPTSIYALGLGQVWIPVGLAIGYTISWLLEAPRLRKFSIVANDSITIPQYLTNRFLSKSLALQVICAIVFLVAYTIYVGEFTDNAFSKYRNSAFFTVENGKALNGKIENVKRFAELGVRIMTLTWNEMNEIGSGVLSEDKCGLTDFGKLAVAEMEKYGIVIDVSHASDGLFYDVVNQTNKPFIATHSDSRTITQNPRNLTDEQIKIIIQRGGLIGLNLHNAFLNNNPDKACMNDILKHCEYMLSLGCENSLCFGTDFDGCDLPRDIVGSDSIGEIYELFLGNNYNESVLKKIFYENAYNFFENFDNQRIM